MNRRTVVALSLALVSAAGWRLAEACGPFFITAVFSYKRHPDLPRSAFIEGRLGVLQPTFARSYLVIAYRHLNGIGMSSREREQARDYYADRDTGSWDSIGEDWLSRWRKVRSQIQPPPPPTRLITGGQLAYNPETHSFALNCAEDAFRTAIHTLDARRSRFGAASRALRSWLDAQDRVFANCEGGPPAIPPPASADLPPLIRADRDYQVAAAHFYAHDYPPALDLFRRIGQDNASPWSAISRYLVVRTLLRMTDDQTPVSDQVNARLQAEAQSILGDPKLLSIHGMTWNLVARAGIRARDQSYFRELARLLSSRGQDNGLREELWNYTGMYDRVIGEDDPNSFILSAKTFHSDPSRFRDADLSDWIFCFQTRDPSAFAHSLARWKQTRSPAWLLAALSHASAASASENGLIQEAESVPETSPAYLTARFHIFRLYEQLGQTRAARDGVTSILSSTLVKDLPSSVNLFRGLRMLAAPALDDFLQFAVRKPLMITWQENIPEAPNFDAREEPTGPVRFASGFDRDAARVLNRETPFRLLASAALGDSLPAGLRREALTVAFTRGLMLDKDLSEIARKLAATESDLAPLTEGYLRETTAEGRRFAAAFLVLHRPESRPYFASNVSRQTPPGKLDSFRDNWWCPLDIDADLDSRANMGDWDTSGPTVLQRSTRDVTPEFLSGDVAAEAKSEFARLGAMHAATDFLGGVVFRYAESNRDDPRIPEALHYLVRSGHYGCVDVGTWRTTRAAFRMLHLNYPRSVWTRRTPTWFKNDYDIRREIAYQLH